VASYPKLSSTEEQMHGEESYAGISNS